MHWHYTLAINESPMHHCRSDLAEFNDLKHAITAVHLVKRPLQSQYGAGVDYILVIATTCDLLLYAVSMMQKQNGALVS